MSQIDIFDEVIVDNFAGGGGASTGIELAAGRPVAIAINHDPDAILLHKTNHPYTEHLQASVWDVDPVEVCRGRPVGLAWFSPDCKHFSKAKGAALRDRKIRGLAWIVLRWAGTVRPRVIMLENVEEFQTWGPVRKGKPVKKHAGKTFKQFIRQLEDLGYVVEYRELVAADYGAPTTRKRFALIARCDGKPIVWPERTHAPRDSEEVKSGKLKPWRSAAEIIDWTLPSYSIFDSKQEIKERFGVNAIRPLADNTLRRVIRGVDKFTIKSGKPFIVQQKFGNAAQDIERPLTTVTSVGAHELVQPVIAPFGAECNHSGGGHVKDLREPLNTVTGKHTGGGAAAVAVPYTFSNTGGSVGSPASEPVHTIRSAGGQVLASAELLPAERQLGRFDPKTGMWVYTEDEEWEQDLRLLRQMAKEDAEAEAVNLMSIGQTGGGDRIRDIREPVPTTVSKQEACVVAANLIQYHTEQSEKVRGQAVTDPIQTVDAANRYGLASAQLVEYYGNGNPLDVQEPMHTVTAHDREAVVCAHIDKYFNGEYKGCGDKAGDPLYTVTALPRHGLCSAHIQKFFGGVIGQEATEPMPTVTAVDHNALCAAHVVKFKGQELGQHPTDTLNTITAQGLEYADCRAVLTKIEPGRNLGRWPQIRELLNKYCGYDLKEDEIILLLIRGIAYYIADITLRMLTPRELYNAMGFPVDYQIERDYLGNAYGKNKQVARCGNAVCPPLAEAMVKANFPEWNIGKLDTMAQFHDAVAV